MKIAGIAAALLACVGLFPASVGARQLRTEAVCAASPVHYGAAPATPRGVAGVPWVASTNAAFRGYLFYWGGTSWAREHSPSLRIFTKNAHVRVHPKVLWIALRPSFSTIAIHGTRLDGPGSFSSRYPAAIGGGQFPSYVIVPAAGCWRVTIASGDLRGSLTFLATDKA